MEEIKSETVAIKTPENLKKYDKKVINSLKVRAVTTAHNKRLFIEAFPSQLWHIGDTCKCIGIDHSTYKDWIKKDPAFKLALDETREQMIAFAEKQLIVNIRAGKEASLFFFLTNMKPEIWKQRQPIGGYGPQNVTINYGYRSGHSNGNEGNNDKPLRREAGRLIVPSPADSTESS